MQDVTGVILASVVLATLDGEPGAFISSLLGLAAYAAVAIVIALALPPLLRRLRAQPDLFLLTSVASGLALAGLGAVAFGVPLALAAFIGGLAITEDPVSREARRQLLPFRDFFAVLFFVAIGALIDPRELAEGLGWLGLFLALIVGAKVLPAYLIARRAGIGTRPLQLAVGLGQIGEFSFVLAALLAAEGAIDSSVYVAMIAAVAISIGASTILVRLVPGPVGGTAAAERRERRRGTWPAVDDVPGAEPARRILHSTRQELSEPQRFERDQPGLVVRRGLAVEADPARALGVEHDERDAQPLVLGLGVGARVVELVEHVGVDAARAPLAVVGLRRTRPLDGHVVGVDLRAAPRRTGCAARDGPRRRPRVGASSSAVSASTSAPRSWLRAWSPRSAMASETARMASERSRSDGSTPGPKSVGNIVRQPSGSSVSPFMTARASSRWVGLASASRPAARATTGSAWMAA